MRRDLAVDLGSANLRVVRWGDGLVIDEPSVLAVDRRGKVLALQMMDVGFAAGARE